MLDIDKIPDFCTFPGNPSNTNVNENCIELHVDGIYQWNDDECYKPLNYICEVTDG